MAELFQTTPQNITLHLKSIYSEEEQIEEATCKYYLQVRDEGGRRVQRQVRYYRLEVILAIGFRVRSHRGIQFRQWASSRLEEYLRQGFLLDDERLKNPPSQGVKDYFDSLLERIRDIRASEKRMYLKIKVADKLALEQYEKFQAKRLVVEAKTDESVFEETLKKLSAISKRMETNKLKKS